MSHFRTEQPPCWSSFYGLGKWLLVFLLIGQILTACRSIPLIDWGEPERAPH